MNEEWKEIPIEGVKPGDVARCNGREFQIGVSCFDEAWECHVGEHRFSPHWWGFSELGFTFHRRANMEPWTGISPVLTIDSLGGIYLPPSLIGKSLRWEILDDEGNGGGA